MSDNIVVNVVIIAYKHEEFVGQAIESIVKQKTNFRFNLLIAEDKSPDNTRKICEEWAERYPDIIDLLPSDRNHGSQPNFVRVLSRCTAKYCAICEGDDYWTDEYKLQKQYDLMEKHPEMTLCFTDFKIIDQNDKTLPKYPELPVKKEYTLLDVTSMRQNYIRTATLFWRNVLEFPMPDYFCKAINGDIALHIYLLAKGNAILLPDVTAAYRKHAGGLTADPHHIATGEHRMFGLFEQAHEYYGAEHAADFRAGLCTKAQNMLMYGSKHLTGRERNKHIMYYLGKYRKYCRPQDRSKLLYYILVLYFPWLLRIIAKRK